MSSEVRKVRCKAPRDQSRCPITGRGVDRAGRQESGERAGGHPIARARCCCFMVHRRRTDVSSTGTLPKAPAAGSYAALSRSAVGRPWVTMHLEVCKAKAKVTILSRGATTTRFGEGFFLPLRLPCLTGRNAKLEAPIRFAFQLSSRRPKKHFGHRSMQPMSVEKVPSNITSPTKRAVALRKSKQSIGVFSCVVGET